ncbi:hypothetical protein BC830DRAFT_1166471 [Chytriomyces sp. MP71]|nr:hypothetical protein BC830DRAFT_1166471 [Chytriomyces sp. MP71]
MLLEAGDAYAHELEAGNPVAANKGFCAETTLPKYAPNGRLSPTHLRIALNATEEALSAKRVAASVAITVNGFPGASGSLAVVDRVLALNAVDLSIEKVDGVDDWDHDGKLLTLRWNAGFEGARTVVVSYLIERPIAGLYFHVADETAPNRALHAITDHETERARYWLPCVDQPLVRTTLEFVITHSTKHTAIANGLHISTTPSPTDASRSTTVYKLANHTCPSYLICFAVGDLVVANDGDVDGMKLQYLCSRDHEFVTPENLLRTFGNTGNIVRWMQDKVGYKFPWEKYAQIISPRIEYGAMENISLVTYKNVYLFNEDLGKDGFDKQVNSTNVHEMAHTYFGDLLTMRHFEHVWLKESWATYIDYCYSEDHYSHDEARLKIFQAMEGYISETSRYVRPIVCRTYESSWDMFDMHTYPGGAFRIHMLRHIVGDDAFWKAVKKYVNAFAGKSVETEDFKRALEQESGLNLTKFFDQWIYGRGYPKLKATYEYDAAKGLVQLTLEQTQGDKALEIPDVFEVVVEVDVKDAKGEIYTTEVVFNDLSGKKVIAYLRVGNAKPEVVEIDPRGKVLHSLDFNPGEAVLEATMRKGVEVSSRVRAYRQLIKNGGVNAYKKVAAALRDEPFFGVRSLVYRALEKEETQTAINILADSLATETDPRSLVILANASGAKDPRIRAGLLALLQRPSAQLSPRIRRFAYANLGRQAHPDDAAFLIAASQDPASHDIHSFTLTGIVDGLGQHRSAAAFAHLEKLLFELKPDAGRGVPEDVHIGAVMAYASTAVWQESALVRRAAAEKLASLVRADPSHRVQRAAIRALTKFTEGEAKPYLGVCGAVAATAFAEQDTAEVVKLVSGMRGDSKNVGELKKTVEDLEGKIRKLEDTVLLLDADRKEKDKAAADAKAAEAKAAEAPKA